MGLTLRELILRHGRVSSAYTDIVVNPERYVATEVATGEPAPNLHPHPNNYIVIRSLAASLTVYKTVVKNSANLPLGARADLPNPPRLQ